MNTATSPSRFLLNERLALALAALLLVPLGAQAQPTTDPPGAASPAAAEGLRTAYLVRSADMMPVVLMSARTSLTNAPDEGFGAAAADVVVVGPAVDALTTGGPHADALQKSLDAGVRVVACGLAMDKMNVAEGDLIDGIDTVPNGFHELFHLQDEGYETLQL
jgi:intracellular sulfur oxidation DsrE/DsrF family protein